MTIKEKIKNGEGYIEIETLGIIKVSDYNNLTDPQWNKSINDYQDQINFLYSEYENDKNNLLVELEDLEIELENSEKEFDNPRLSYLYQKLKNEEAKYDVYNKDEKIRAAEEKRMSEDPIVIDLESQIYAMNNYIWNNINKNKNEIDKKNQEIKDLKIKLDKRLQDINIDLLSTRQAQNPDYQNNQKLKIIKIFGVSDYKIENDELVLLTDIEKLEIAKINKKKELAVYLQTKYPEKVIDGTIGVLYNEKALEIDALTTIEEIKNYLLNF